ncbi:MAG: ABC transporter permease [Moraxellaceae bacterium]|nr:ABC transporter permease [Moraxellaceae bacterium]
MRLSPLNQRRIANFKANKRGYYAFWLFLVLFVFSLFAEFWANNKPLLVSYKETWYYPVFKEYPETIFGGTLTSNADYRDPFVAELINAQGWIVWPPIPFSYNTINYNLNVPTPAPPSNINWLGTDDQSRDVLARIIYGFRISVLFALTLTIVSSVVGIIVGAIQGFYGGWVDLLGQRFIEIWSGLPMLFMLIIMASLVEPSFWWLLGLMLLFSWTELTGLVRAEFLRGRNLEYVRAARALGLSDAKIMFRHILPNAMVSTLVVFTVYFYRCDWFINLIRFFRFWLACRLSLVG